jgi:hypothetical protein
VRADGDEVESLLAMTKIIVVVAVCRDQEGFMSDTRQSRDLYPAQMQGVVLHATSVFSSTVQSCMNCDKTDTTQCIGRVTDKANVVSDDSASSQMIFR